MCNGLPLSEYDPISRLTVAEHEVLLPKFPVFDAHIHIGALQMGEGGYGPSGPVDVGLMAKRLKESGVKGAVNLKMFWGEPLREHLKTLEGYEDFVYTFASVDPKRHEEPGFAGYVDDLLKQFKSMGVRGLKLWKDIGCTIKDSSGAYISPDDSRLRPIFEAAAKYDLIVLFHIADPVSFFTPVDGRNEFYESLCDNPDWVFYDKGGEGRYSFEDLMEAQDNLLTQNPETTFIIAHVGSNAENLGWVGAQLDKHKNMYIDTAARNNLLGRQPYTARDFFIKYQDRILFGSDLFPNDNKEPRDFYADHYRFFETYDEYFQPYRDWGLCRWNIYGLGLPDEVLRKFYAENAMNLMGLK